MIKIISVIIQNRQLLS